jgi:hypothetical protein
MAGKRASSSNKRTFGPDRTLEDSAGAKGEDRKSAVDANRTGGSERPETKGRHRLRDGSQYDDPDRL